MESGRVAATEERIQRLRDHIRSVRVDIQRRGLATDDPVERCLIDMMRFGLAAIEGGTTAPDDARYKEAATRIHVLVRDQERRRVVPRVHGENLP